MKKHLWVLVALLIPILGACVARPPAEPPATPQENINSEQSVISASRAGELAVEAVGGGSVQEIETISDGTSMQFSVRVDYNGNIYNVVLDAQAGSLISLNMVGQPREQEEAALDDAATTPAPEPVPDSMPESTPEPTPQPQNDGAIIIPENITPRAPGRAGGPENPAISAQRAVELARDHLVSIGVTNARFDYVYMDREDGVWVWSVEFDGQGRDFEFYVDVETGELIRVEWDD